MKLGLVMLLFLAMHAFAWFGANSQHVWRDQPSAMLTALMFGVPVALTAYMATKYGYEFFDSLWSVRMVAQGAFYVCFPTLTWIFLDESPFTTKTIISIILSMVIVAIQFFWKEACNLHRL